jgi:hypothetical protein
LFDIRDSAIPAYACGTAGKDKPSPGMIASRLPSMVPDDAGTAGMAATDAASAGRKRAHQYASQWQAAQCDHASHLFHEILCG